MCTSLRFGSMTLTAEVHEHQICKLYGETSKVSKYREPGPQAFEDIRTALVDAAMNKRSGNLTLTCTLDNGRIVQTVTKENYCREY
jgi:hypothetical protein